MKKIVSLVLIVILVHACAHAQRKRMDSMLAIVNTLPDTGKMKVYYFLGADYINISVDSAQMYLGQAISLAKEHKNQKVEAQCYSLFGVAEKNMGNYEKAIGYDLSSLKIHEAAGDEKEIAICYNDLGVLYKNMKRPDEAMNYYRRSNELCRKIGLSGGVSMTYNNIGTIFKTKNLPDSALYYFTLALHTAEQTNNTYNISTCLANIGEVYEQRENYTEALTIFKRCLGYDKINEDKYSIASSYLEIAQTLDNMKQYGPAIQYADSSYRVCAAEKLMTVMLDVLQEQAHINKRSGNTNKALELEEKYVALKDSIMNGETSKTIAELQTKYETAKKEKQITTLKQQKEITSLNLAKEELALQRSQYRMIAVVGIMVLLIIVAWLLYNRQQVKQKVAREKAIQLAEYNERMRIAKDVHDDLGSGLSKISLTANVAEQKALNNGNAAPDIRNIAALSKDLVDNMRDLIWVLNPENTTLDNLITRLREYSADYLDGLDLEADISFPDTVPDMRISRETQRNIFATVKEAIHNCVKHASATEVAVRATLRDGRLNIVISDNGKGIDMKNLRSGGNGLRNMRQRIESVGGSFDIKNEGGTAIHISAPLSVLESVIVVNAGKNTTKV